MNVEHFEERRVCVARHDGPMETVDETRRPMYQHMISNELVGGASMLRFDGEGMDVLIGATCDFNGDDNVSVELLPAGNYACEHYEGPADGIPGARDAFLDNVRAAGHEPVGRILQVHLMDEIDGELEQEFQVRLA